MGFSGGEAKSTPNKTGVTVIEPTDEQLWKLTENKDGSITLTLSKDTVSTGIKLGQNVDSQVYMYVYLDGTNMGNELADAVNNKAVSITVNTQFSNKNMNDGMGMKATTNTTTSSTTGN